MDRDIRQFLTQATERQEPGALRSAYRLMESAAAARSGGRSGGRTPRVAPELYVVCAEAALQLGCVELSSGCLKRFFEGNPPANQFLCRAYLCRGRLEAPPTTGRAARTVDTSPHGELGDFEEAVLCFLKAIEMSKCDPSCHFAAFNASVLYLQTVRPLLQPGRRRRLVPSLGKVVRSLEELADRDLGWRAELMMQVKPSVLQTRDRRLETTEQRLDHGLETTEQRLDHGLETRPRTRDHRTETRPRTRE
ncbi:Cilia- and flagella-associated protein 46 [Liparis tanakae]|uniref:Cilia-and flagella-associated protein 46 n=1 Tax=Liparis tanakae TaxID=230148 RepID=A0A4Z2FJF1_9TELE|nr:Cilia- and flagella-associated protein 46 [Liparis tanakae]